MIISGFNIQNIFWAKRRNTFNLPEFPIDCEI